MTYPKQLHQVDGVDVIRYLFGNQIFYLILTLLGSNMQCRVHILRGGVHLSAMLQQQHHNVHIAESRGDMQRSLLLPSSCIDLGAIAQKYSDDVRLKLMNKHFQINGFGILNKIKYTEAK